MVKNIITRNAKITEHIQGIFKLLSLRMFFFGAASGSTSAVADGFHVITIPVIAGNHTVKLKAELISLGVVCDDQTFTTDNAYYPIVE